MNAIFKFFSGLLGVSTVLLMHTPAYAPLINVSELSDGAKKVYLYGLRHDKDDTNRNLLMQHIEQRKSAENTDSKIPSLNLGIEDPADNPEFCEFLPPKNDFLWGLVHDLRAINSQSTTIFNCDPRKVSWLSINLYNNGLHPHVPHHTPHLIEYTFADLFNELNEQFERTRKAQNHVALFKNACLARAIEESISTAAHDYDTLQQTLKDSKIKLSDSIALKALDLFCDEIKNEQIYGTYNRNLKQKDSLAKLMCFKKHASHELQTCLHEQATIKESIRPPAGYITGTRGALGELLLTITDPLMEVPAVVNVLNNRNTLNAFFVGDTHRKHMKSLFMNASFKNTVPFDLSTVDPQNAWCYNPEEFTPNKLQYLQHGTSAS